MEKAKKNKKIKQQKKKKHKKTQSLLRTLEASLSSEGSKAAQTYLEFSNCFEGTSPSFPIK